MAVCPDLVIIISRSDEPPFAKDQPREQQLCQGFESKININSN